MMKLFLVALIALAVWYGYNHYGDILHQGPQHEAVIENQTGHTVVKLRVGVGEQTLVRETLDPGATARLPFRIDRDSPLRLDWEYSDAMNEFHWTGATIPKGPLAQRHVITLASDGGVTYFNEKRTKDAS